MHRDQLVLIPLITRLIDQLKHLLRCPYSRVLRTQRYTKQGNGVAPAGAASGRGWGAQQELDRKPHPQEKVGTCLEPPAPKGRFLAESLGLETPLPPSFEN